jgi:hypothetical protein
MNYLQYAFYVINIYLEKVMEDFRSVRVNLAIWPRARKLVCQRHWLCKGCTPFSIES